MLQFGKSLQDDERFEFRWRSHSPIEYTADSRRRLYSRLQVAHFLADGAIVGRVTGMQAEAQTFDFVTLRERVLHGRYSDPGMTDDFEAVLHSVAEAPVVRLDGELLWTSDDEPVEINEVPSMEDGGVQAEWHTDKIVLSAEISPDLTIGLYRLKLADKSDADATVGTVPEAIRFILEAGV